MQSTGGFEGLAAHFWILTRQCPSAARAGGKTGKGREGKGFKKKAKALLLLLLPAAQPRRELRTRIIPAGCRRNGQGEAVLIPAGRDSSRRGTMDVAKARPYDLWREVRAGQRLGTFPQPSDPGSGQQLCPTALQTGAVSGRKARSKGVNRRAALQHAK